MNFINENKILDLIGGIYKEYFFLETKYVFNNNDAILSLKISIFDINKFSFWNLVLI